MFFGSFGGIVLQCFGFDIRMDWCGIRWMKEVGDGVSFDDKMDGTCFGTENFLDYLNKYILENKSEKAYIIKEDYTPTTPRQIKEQKKLKKLYF